jgi:hypothetical protein
VGSLRGSSKFKLQPIGPYGKGNGDLDFVIVTKCRDSVFGCRGVKYSSGVRESNGQLVAK